MQAGGGGGRRHREPRRAVREAGILAEAAVTLPEYPAVERRLGELLRVVGVVQELRAVLGRNRQTVRRAVAQSPPPAAEELATCGRRQPSRAVRRATSCTTRHAPCTTRHAPRTMRCTALAEPRTAPCKCDALGCALCVAPSRRLGDEHQSNRTGHVAARALRTHGATRCALRSPVPSGAHFMRHWKSVLPSFS